MAPNRQTRRGAGQPHRDALDEQGQPSTALDEREVSHARDELRQRLHTALDALLDGLDEYRRAPVAEELVRVRSLPLEIRAREELVRSGKLRTVRLGRELWTRRSWLVAAVDAMPPARARSGNHVEADGADEADDVLAAARRRAQRRSA